MKKQRQTRKQLDAEIEALIKRRMQLEEDAVEEFMKTFVTKDIKVMLSNATASEIKATARIMSNSFKKAFANAREMNSSVAVQ